jgi:hypothetical protein
VRVPALDFDGTTGLDDEADGFDAAMRAFFASALRVARAVLSALERRLEAPAGWFEATYGPLEDHAQWHVKRFVPGEASPHAVTADGDIARSSNQRAMGWMGLDGVGWGWMGLDGVGWGWGYGAAPLVGIASGLALLSHAVTAYVVTCASQCASQCQASWLSPSLALTLARQARAAAGPLRPFSCLRGAA